MSRTVTATKTDGVSPKATAATLAPIVVGLLLAAADKLFAGDDIPDELWLGLIGAGPLAGLSAFGAKPGRVQLKEAGPAVPPPAPSGGIGPL